MAPFKLMQAARVFKSRAYKHLLYIDRNIRIGPVYCFKREQEGSVKNNISNQTQTSVNEKWMNNE